MMSDFRDGLSFWWLGWGYVFRNRSLLAVAVMPALLALLFTAGFTYVIYMHLGVWVHSFISTVIGLASGFWYDIAYYPLVLGGGLVVLIASVYVAFVLQLGLAVPFNSVLAQKTLERRGLSTEISWSDTLRMLKTGIFKTLILLVLGLVLFVFSFVPMLNLLAITAALFIMAFDLMDYSFDAAGIMGFRRRLGYLFKYRAQWAGMAAGLALTLLVPGLTLLVTPGAVVGCALIMKEPE
jgi:uncharacterized protein involved in cysteine biosynthesis